MNSIREYTDISYKRKVLFVNDRSPGSKLSEVEGLECEQSQFTIVTDERFEQCLHIVGLEVSMN